MVEFRLKKIGDIDKEIEHWANTERFKNCFVNWLCFNYDWAI